MGLLDRLKGEMKSAGEAVRDTLDEGKTRIEIFRVRCRPGSWLRPASRQT